MRPHHHPKFNIDENVFWIGPTGFAQFVFDFCAEKQAKGGQCTGIFLLRSEFIRTIRTTYNTTFGRFSADKAGLPEGLRKTK